MRISIFLKDLSQSVDFGIRDARCLNLGESSYFTNNFIQTITSLNQVTLHVTLPKKGETPKKEVRLGRLSSFHCWGPFQYALHFREGIALKQSKGKPPSQTFFMHYQISTRGTSFHIGFFEEYLHFLLPTWKTNYCSNSINLIPIETHQSNCL